MAKNLDVLLTQHILKLGTLGDIVSVKPGYARNYLFPQGLAIPANAAAKRQVEVLKERAAKLAVEHEAQALALKKGIDGKTITIEVKVAHDDVLFGSVGARDIVAALAADGGARLEASQVRLHENFKKLGSYKVSIDLAQTVEANITVKVLSDNPDGPGLDEALAAAAADNAEESAEEG